MFGGGNGISTGRVEHDNPAAGRCLNINIVYTDAGAADNAQFCSGIQDLRTNFRFASNDDRAEFRDEGDKFRFG